MFIERCHISIPATSGYIVIFPCLIPRPQRVGPKAGVPLRGSVPLNVSSRLARNTQSPILRLPRFVDGEIFGPPLQAFLSDQRMSNRVRRPTLSIIEVKTPDDMLKRGRPGRRSALQRVREKIGCVWLVAM